MNLINNDLFSLFLSNNVDKYTYNPYNGINEYILTSYSEHIHKQAIIFFKLLDLFKLEYVVFAGSSVGMVRNKCMMPWTDDYDIIILDKNKNYFFNKIMPTLKMYGYCFWGCGTDRRGDESGNTFVSGIYTDNIAFRTDIFWSKINKNNIIENVNGRGLYHKKKLSADIFFPPRYISFNEITLPFSNKYEKEVKLTYGDVKNQCIIKSHSRLAKGKKILYNKWEDAFLDYKKLKEKAIENTKTLININNYKPDDKILLLDNIDIKDPIDLLKIIVKENIKTVNCINFEKFMKVSGIILFYFPEIKINLFLSNFKDINFFYLNYATSIYVYNVKIKNKLDELEYINKPIINITKIITFGTFDLLHIGHKNIIDKCNMLSEKIVIGVSTDELNKIKNKTSHENITCRINNIKEYSKTDLVFKEESLDKKLDYIKQYKCNVVVMGDDWENKFNSKDYECIYFKRTPGISSTLLRKKLV